MLNSDTQHNKGSSLFPLTLICCLIMLLCSSHLFAVDTTHPRIRLTTRLGVEIEVSVQNIEIENDVLLRALKRVGYRVWSVPLEIKDSVYVSLPLDSIYSVSMKDGKHVVHMKNGQELRGKLSGKISTIDRKSYDLSGVVSMEVLFVPGKKTSKNTNINKMIWVLKVPGEDSISYTVVSPMFVFKYYSSAGYAIGGTSHETTDMSFYLKVGEEEYQANIEDFKRLTYVKTVKTAKTDLTVESKSGVITSGTLVLRKDDSVGSHRAGRDWVLSAFIASNNRVIVVLKREWTLIQL